MNTALRVSRTGAEKIVDANSDLDKAAELAACVARHLNGGRKESCRPVWFRRKMGKLLVECDVEIEDHPEADLRHCICKVYRADRGQGHFDALSRLREAGFRPPSPFTVVYPVVYIADQCLLVQEKAPGRLLADIIFDESDASIPDAVEQTAGWLAALHGAAVEAEPRMEKVRTSVARYGRELAEFLPSYASRIERLTDHALLELEDHRLTPLVPSHGDFHPKNVFITGGGRVTGIDFDTFGLQERAADIAYLLGQTAIIGRFRHGSFAITAQVRHTLLRNYLELTSYSGPERVPLYLGMVFLQSLHYELCTLGNGKVAIIETWLANAERCLLHGEVTLFEDSVG